ncbi:MAG TPA: hypothetical protein VN947_18120 [Polyangia bacterium]|nr:hypothetical protein [Polyangia bacterium]
MWSCDTCGRPNRHNPLICETCGAAAPGADANQVNLALQRDLAMESHLRGLAFWYRIGAVVFGAGFLVLFGLVGGALVSSPLHGSSALMASAFGYVAMFVVAAAAGSYVLGHYLGRFANGARIAAAILSIVGLAFTLLRFVLTCVAYSRLSALYGDSSLFADAQPSLMGPIVMFVLSALWSGAIILTLFSGRAAQVCSPAYRTIVARTAAMKASMVKTPFFVVPLVVTILAAMVVLRLLMAMRGLY